MIAVPHDLDIELQPLELSGPRTIRSLLTRIRDLYAAIEKRFGSEGLDLIRDVSEQYGRDIANRARARKQDWTLEDVGKFLIQVFNNIDTVGVVEEFRPHRVAICVERCPYPLETCALCSAHTSMEHALVHGLNPDLEYVVEHSIPAGDKYCLHVLQAKSS